jgi:hypothetical protein
VQFEKILRDGAQLSEDMGEAMARWASGIAATIANAPVVAASSAPVVPDAAEAMLRINACETEDSLRSAARQLTGLTWSDAQRKAIKATVDARAAALKTERKPNDND